MVWSFHHAHLVFVDRVVWANPIQLLTLLFPLGSHLVCGAQIRTNSTFQQTFAYPRFVYLVYPRSFILIHLFFLRVLIDPFGGLTWIWLSLSLSLKACIFVPFDHIVHPFHVAYPFYTNIAQLRFVVVRFTYSINPHVLTARLGLFIPFINSSIQPIQCWPIWMV